MIRRLDPEALRAFARRRWDLVEQQKREFAAERFRSGGPSAARAAARRLHEKWRALHPDAPLAAMRAADLAAHIALKRKLDQTGSGNGEREAGDGNGEWGTGIRNPGSGPID